MKSVARYSVLSLMQSYLVVAALLIAGPAARLLAQSESTESSTGCTLTDHVYRCDGAVFQRALNAATSVAIETHNVDGVARRQLTDLVTRKLGKTIAADGTAADLVFLMEPVGQEGMLNESVGGADLGTLRIYSAGPGGSRKSLLWAETYTGPADTPWPAVVHGLIQQFQSRFHIK